MMDTRRFATKQIDGKTPAHQFKALCEFRAFVLEHYQASDGVLHLHPSRADTWGWLLTREGLAWVPDKLCGINEARIATEATP